MSIASAVVRAIFPGSFTVCADLTSGETKGRWSISWSEPLPHLISGARPPRATSGTPSAWAEAIPLIPLVTPQPAVSAQMPGLARCLRPADRREDGGLLVAGVDHVDPLRLAAVEDGEEVAAGEREELGCAAALIAWATSRPPCTGRRVLVGFGALGPPLDLLAIAAETTARPAPAARRARRARLRARGVPRPPCSPAHGRAWRALARASSPSRRACARPPCAASPVAGARAARPPRGPCRPFAGAPSRRRGAEQADRCRALLADHAAPLDRLGELGVAGGGLERLADTGQDLRPHPVLGPIASAARVSESTVPARRCAAFAQLVPRRASRPASPPAPPAAPSPARAVRRPRRPSAPIAG